jgi:hypothetical protein
MDRETAKKWIDEFNKPLMEVNRILRKMNDEGVKPEIHVFQDPKRLGEGLQQIEVSMFPNPHYSEWTKLHIDFCQRVPNAPMFYKLWMPTYAILFGWIYGLKIDVNIRTGKHIFRV